MSTPQNGKQPQPNMPKPKSTRGTSSLRGGFMGRGRGGMMSPAEKPKDFKGTLRKLAPYLAPYRVTIIFVFVLAIGSTVFSIVGPKIMGNATTELFNGILAKLAGSGDVPFDTISRILLTALGLYLVTYKAG